MSKVLSHSLILIFFLLISFSLSAQSDSEEKYRLQYEQIRDTSFSNPDYAIKKALEWREEARMKKDQLQLAFVHHAFGNIYWLLGDFPQSLDYYQKAFREYEAEECHWGVASIYNDRAVLSKDWNNLPEAVQLLKSALEVSNSNLNTVVDKELHAVVLFNLTEMYVLTGQEDSAEIYVNELLPYLKETKNKALAYAVLSMAGAALKDKNMPDTALSILNLANTAALKEGDYRYAAQTQIEMGKALLMKDLIDSAAGMFRSSLALGTKIHSEKIQLEASEEMFRLFDSLDYTDQALFYLRKVLLYKESLESAAKVRQEQNMKHLEEIRVAKMEELRREEELKEHHMLQYRIIIIVIVIFLLLIVLFSHRVHNARLLEVLISMVLLLLFEFLAMVTHSIVGSLTDHSPLFMIIPLVLVAALMMPLHHKLIHWSKERLIRKGKKV